MDYSKFPLGAKPSPPDERDFPITKLTPIKYTFPEEFILPYNHEIKNQGQINSCVAHSLAYCREIVEEQQSGTFKKVSAGFIYGNRADSDYQGEGWHPREALSHLLEDGCCEYDQFPYNEEYPGIREKVLSNKDTLLKNARPNKITAYARIRNLEEIRTALFQLKSPVTFIMKITPSFYNISRYNPVFSPPSGSESLYGYHEMTIIGWEKHNGMNCLKILNSWGSSWGDNGFFYIPFSIFDTKSYYFVEFWSITDNLLPGGDDMSTPYNREPKAIVIHHMGDGLSPSVSISQRWNPFNYTFPEYDFGVEYDGTIKTGRPLTILGAHTRCDKEPYLSVYSRWWFNENSIGIGIAGDFTTFSMPHAQFDGLVELVRELMKQYNIPIDMVFKHNDVTYTDCPGNTWSWDTFKIALMEEKKMFENLVVYGGFDDGAANLLADKLKAPLVHIDNVTDDLWSCAKNKYKVGGGAFRDAKVVSGDDRFATMQAVLNL